ncbi:hypothetical protein [Streptomyces sp. NPDC044948]|uniref:hypothetical protein n=1 Tax=Streptomyces sp. NPDC044948 TaxID=3157092 RepID=UPI0033C363FA
MDAFYALAVLACPVGMGAMMWFMMKGNRKEQGGGPAPQDKAAGYAGFTTDPRQKEVDALRAEVESLRTRLDGRPADAVQEQEHTR